MDFKIKKGFKDIMVFICQGVFILFMLVLSFKILDITPGEINNIYDLRYSNFSDDVGILPEDLGSY